MLKSAFLIVAALCLASSAYAATASKDVDIVITHAGGTILPAPPSGFHWIQTFGDDFNTTFPNSGTSTGPVTLDTSMWTVDHFCGGGNFTSYTSPTWGCGTANTASDTAGGNLLTMTVQSSTPATRNIINTYRNAGCIAGACGYIPTNPFVQRYGYFVYNAKVPTCIGGEIDLEAFARDVWLNGQSGAYGEFGLVSATGGACNISHLRAYEGSGTVASHGFTFLPNPDLGVDLSQAFHQYGLLWVNDGSPHGSVHVYFDGTDVTGAYQLQSPAWDNGLYFDVYWSPGPGSEGGTGGATTGTMQFDFVRAYQLVPG